MESWERYISEWVPSELGLLTKSFLFFLNLKLNVASLIDAVH